MIFKRLDMKHLIVILIVAVALYSCSSAPQEPAVHHVRDTVKSVVRTDTGVFIKFSYLLDGLETASELRKARAQGETEPFLKSVFGYDTLGNRILVINSKFNELKNDFVHVSKEEFEVDKDKGSTFSTMYVERNDEWKPKERLGRTLDQKGNVLALETYAPEGSGWVIKTKTFYKYDANNLVTEKTDYRADSLGEWHPVDKVQREFKNALLVTEIISGPAPNNQWALKSKAEYEYNLGNQCSRSTSYIIRNGQWTNYVKSEYTYDAAGTMLECNTYFWNEAYRRWTFYDKEEF